MLRHKFGGGIAEWTLALGVAATSQSGLAGNLTLTIPGVLVTFWDAPTGGNQYSDLLDSTLTPITSVTSDANGAIPQAVWGPPGVRGMWADAGGGPGTRRWITAADVGDDLTTLETAVAGLGLDALADVDTTGVTDGQALTYVAASAMWQPGAGGGGGGAATLDGLADVTAPSPVDGQVLRYSQGSSRWEPAILGLADIGLDVVNVREFGTVGDGVADDTAAIQAAIDSLPTGGGTVYLPRGTYKISAALTVRSRLRLIGAGDGSTSTVIFQTNTAANGLTGVDIDRLVVQSLKIFGPENGTGIGISLTRSANAATTYCTFNDLYVASFGGDGINISNPIVSTFSRVISETHGGHGFNLNGVPSGAAGTSCSLVSCYGNGNAQAGIRLFNMVYCALTGCAGDSNGIGYLLDQCQGVTLSGCGAEFTENKSVSYPGTSFTVVGGFGNSLIGCWVFNNGGIGIYVTGTAHTVGLVGCTDNTPGVGATNFVKVDAGSGVVMTACSNSSPNSIANGTTQTLDDGGGGMMLRAFLYGAADASFEQNITSFGGNLITSLAGKGVRIKEGANAKMGTATLNGTTLVVVNNTSVTATSRILLATQAASATYGAPVVATRVAGTSFSIKSTVAGDTSTVAWMIVEPS